MDDSPAPDWRPAVADDAVGPAGLVEIDLDDLELVAWRSVDGVLTVCDARCPHQWSHLAFEGIVDGDELLCTAHFWRFDAEGRGSKLAMNGRRDPKSGVATYPCRVRDGMIEVDVSRPVLVPEETVADQPL
jgi:nitrite reductase/ring-hydroxylating ferredoxin subunit